MAKAPAFQFYPDDFLRDTLELSLAARGAWITLLCKMWYSVTPGRISMPIAGYARTFGAMVDQAQAVIDELCDTGVCDAETDRHGKITLINRRMFTDYLSKKDDADRAKRYRDRQRNKDDSDSSQNHHGEITPYSSSPTLTLTSDDLIDSYVRACVSEHSDKDARLVEIAVLETLIRRKGSLNEAKPIKSMRYFDEEIKIMCSPKGGQSLGDKTIENLLKRRREQVNAD